VLDINTKTQSNIMNTLSNNVQLIGHLGRNPEVKTFENGNKVAKLLLATSEYRKNAQGEKETHTTWHNLQAWGNQASIAERFLIKGKKIAISGKIENKNYTDKDGIKKYFTEIRVNEIQMIA
jgi:single-strand DNA-binding protein